MSNRTYKGHNRLSNKKPNSAKDATNPAEGKDSSTENPHARSLPPCGKVHQPKPNPNGDNPESNQKHWLDYAIGVFAFIAAIGGIGAAIFGGIQAYIANDTEKRQLRAYVMIAITNPVKLAAGSSVTVHVIAVNSGQTPVRNLSIRAEILSFSDIQQFYRTLSKADTLPVIQEGSFFGKDHDMQMSSERSLTQEEVDRLGKSVFLAFVGRVTYYDVFNEVHHTYFCRYYPEVNAQITGSCAVGNDTD